MKLELKPCDVEISAKPCDGYRFDADKVYYDQPCEGTWWHFLADGHCITSMCDQDQMSRDAVSQLLQDTTGYSRDEFAQEFGI